MEVNQDKHNQMCNIETQPIYLVEIVEWEASGIIIDCFTQL